MRTRKSKQESTHNWSHKLWALILVWSVTGLVPAVAKEAAPTILITGSNASHGLAFAEEYA
ncbi:MAG: hypothetical protein QGF92_05395, partial [Gammaproteobacteria bacterium]|nr:hypothetical protein [Gammaproteobacteria bacterium]